MRDLAPCSHRGPEAAPGVFLCRSNRPRLPEPGLAPAAFCAACQFAGLPNATQAPAGLLSPQETEHLLPMAGCSHRGAEPIRIGTCDQCGMKGQPFQVYPCGLHGECSIRFYNRKVRACLTCPDCTVD
jgi:hypothetical protein